MPINNNKIQFVFQKGLLLYFEVISLNLTHNSDKHVHQVHKDNERRKNEKNPQSEMMLHLISPFVKVKVSNLTKGHLEEESECTSNWHGIEGRGIVWIAIFRF